MCKLFKDDHAYPPNVIAARLGASRAKVYKMIGDINDPLPAFRLGGNGSLRVTGKDINNYLANHKVEPENE